MAFIIIGVVLLALWLLDWGFVGHLDWWWIALPFVLALAWWAYADASGLTRKREMEKDEERKAERRRRNIANMGLDHLRGGNRNRKR
ncbi:TIGR04438 family Trp-rich protein [Ideonella azotifigens]|uniref:TIGR04438 family Trp-rich protein n=2 Tax=Ideonella azotifigens TaxID=513160 RepID=A0ABN1KI40_9BURK|nr:TIGR04438 family Trp-rich protein [Ideonella azotifigens]